MFELLNRMEQLLLFMEVLGYTAIALMLLQIFLTLGVLSCQNVYDSSNDSSKDSRNDSSDKLIRESLV